MRLTLLLSVLLCPAARVQAQVPPEVEITPLIKEERPHLLASQVAAADCQAGGLPGTQREELALVRVTLRGAWGRSAEHLAAEKAAALGANCLLSVSASGKEGAEYPVLRSYRAFRVTVPYGPWRVPASPESLAAAAPEPFGSAGLAAPMPPFPAREPAAHADHLGRAMGEAVFLHEVLLKPSRTSRETLEDLTRDVREYFGDASAAKLARLIAGDKVLRIDLRAGTVSEP